MAKNGLKIIEKRLQDLMPYEKNPRRNEQAVDAVAASIREFGFKVPIIIDKDGVIVAGHTRYKAAGRLNMDRVPCIVADDLTEEQVKAFRLADNKAAELAEWDFSLLAGELEGIRAMDMSEFGFNINELEPAEQAEEKLWFENKDKLKELGIDEEDEDYKEFIEKFKIKHTTDDCYTPDIVYDAILSWVGKEYGIDKATVVRPFYPGGDFKGRKYKKTDIVVDNPPFSILSEILKFYNEKSIRFFLFAPALTLFTREGLPDTYIASWADITYENGATVKTSFITNMDDDAVQIRTAPELTKTIREANTENLRALHKELPKYVYPHEVITAAMAGKMARYDVELKIMRKDCEMISALDSQKAAGKAIFGKGFLLSEKAAAEKAAAEKAAAERINADVWELSDREKEIIKKLGQQHDQGGLEEEDH